MKILLITFIFFVSKLELKAQTPQFEWAISFSGLFGNMHENSLTTDINNNIYTTGNFSGTIFFDPFVSVFSLNSYGNSDAIIVKYDANENFIWAKQIGGSATENGYSIITDSLGNIFVTGIFSGTTDFDPSAGIYNITANGISDIFVLKLDASGNFIWAKQIGGANANSLGRTIKLDSFGNIYITGSFNGSVDFDPDNNNFILNSLSNTNDDVFILKLDPSGSFIYANQIAGPSNNYGYDLSIDKTNNIYVIGYFNGTADFDPSISVYNLTSNGSSDIFITKFDIVGNLTWAKNIGGNSFDNCYSICIDKFENIYCTGNFSGVVDFDPNSGISNLNGVGSNNRYILKLSTFGNLIWAKKIGGFSSDHNNGIALDKIGNIYTSGSFLGTANFDPNIGIVNLFSAGFSDVFISKIDSAGNFIWAGRIGGPSIDYGYSIALDKNENIYTTGNFSDQADFDPDENEIYYMSTSGGASYLHKMSQLNVGIQENTTKNKISIYPNPSTKIINVELEILNEKDTKIQILNLLGQVLIEETPTSQNFSFNIQNFPKGLYFLKVISEGNVIETRKIVKE